MSIVLVGDHDRLAYLQRHAGVHLDFSDALFVAAGSLRPEAAVLDLPKNHGEHTVGYGAHYDIGLGQALFEGAFNQPLPNLFRLFVSPSRFWKCHNFILR